MQELGELFSTSHDKVSHLMKQLMEFKSKALVIPELEAEVSSLKDSLDRAQNRLAESEAQQSEVWTHQMA